MAGEETERGGRGKSIRDWTGFAASLIAISLSIYSAVNSHQAEARAQRASLAQTDPSLFFAPVITYAASSLEKTIDKASSTVFDDLKARGVRSLAWPQEERSVGAPFVVEKGAEQPAYVSLLLEVTDGDCATVRRIHVEGLLQDEKLVRNRRDLSEVCASQGILVPLFIYTARDSSPLASEITALRLSFQVSVCEVTYVTKTFHTEKKRDCLEAFDYLPTLG